MGARVVNPLAGVLFVPPPAFPSQRTHRLWLALDRHRWPTPWLFSLALHLLAMILLGLAFRMPPPRGVPVGLAAAFSIATDGQDRFDDEAGAQDSAVMPGGGSAERSEPATANRPAAALQQLLGGPAPADPTSALPAAVASLGSAALEGGGVGRAGGAGQGTGRGPGRGGFDAGRTTTSIFGVPGEGYKFVYVFDRSGSTGGPRNTLAAAKAELIASLRGLESTHQFQIIFYNDRLSIFSPTGPGRLVFATEQNKELARRFIGSITSDGGTRHEEALLPALKMQPDVIFFLTDADDPKLLPQQLEKIHRRAGGIQINAIEFGIGPASKEESFMVRLARENGGRYGYVDVTRLAPAAAP